MTLSDYKAFKALYDAGTLGEVTLGVAFCNYFDILDEKLAAETDPKKADKHIINNHTDW